MNHFRRSIILFGFALPLLVAGTFVGVVAYFRGKIGASFKDKSTHYASFQTNRHQALALEAVISQNRSHISNWNKSLREETASVVSSHLRAISTRIPAKEFQQTSFSRPTNSAGFGSVSAQQSVPLELSFRATFRSMQRAFLELESRMPQLQLNDLRIDRTPQSNTLNFQVTYTAWEE